MDQEYSKAVSFTNTYFALADGLVSGLENYLAENVVMDWFGRTIKGRKNVAAFMNTHKIKSRHVVNNIIPTDNIGYKKRPRNRRQKMKDLNNSLKSVDVSVERPLNSEITPVSEITGPSDRSRSSSKINHNRNCVEEGDLTFELHDDDLSTLFKLKNITSTDMEEIEQQINRASLEDKLNYNLLNKWENKELNGCSSAGVVESSIKYVEAYGEILFSKKSRRQNGWSDSKLFSSNSTHTWRKPCKLQIAYSSQQICLPQVLSTNNNTIEVESSTNFATSEQKLLSFEQINELSNHLVPNVNDFGGYLRNINYAKEETKFFKSFDEHVSKTEANKLGLGSRYINGQLAFQNNNSDNQNQPQNGFIFNNLIHVIIYEGRSRCRMNLSEKFA